MLSWISTLISQKSAKNRRIFQHKRKKRAKTLHGVVPQTACQTLFPLQNSLYLHFAAFFFRNAAGCGQGGFGSAGRSGAFARFGGGSGSGSRFVCLRASGFRARQVRALSCRSCRGGLCSPGGWFAQFGQTESTPAKRICRVGVDARQTQTIAGHPAAYCPAPA